MTAIPSLVERLDELIERLGSIPKFVITPEDAEIERYCDEAIFALQAQSARIAELEGEKELSELCAKIEADAVSGLRYIERRYGRLEGVGWDRVFNAHDDLFARASLTKDSTSG